MSVLLYGSECWIPLKKHLRKYVKLFPSQMSLKTVLKISSMKQWEECITSAMVREQWGDMETMDTKLEHRHLEWLGNLSGMPDFRFPKICLFGWLSHCRPFCGPRKRWRDFTKSNLKNVGISDGYWYCQAQEREKWRSICSQSVELSNQPVKNIVYHVCSRSFRRECDKARHKCTVERSKPIQEQADAVQYQLCDRWFRSRRSLAMQM